MTTRAHAFDRPRHTECLSALTRTPTGWSCRCGAVFEEAIADNGWRCRVVTVKGAEA